MQHHFDVDVAREYGMLEAVLLDNMHFWIEKNRANETNYHEGTYWTYNSTKALTKLFPYASQRQIQTALKRLIDAGILVTGNYNASPYDRTLWYALTEKGYSIVQKCKMEDTKKGNGTCKNVEPIPDTNHILEHIDKNTGKRFVPPTVEEVREYCAIRMNDVDAEAFVDFYASKGWYVGKNKMKDWKACVRTWERNSSAKRAKPAQQKFCASTDEWPEF